MQCRIYGRAASGRILFLVMLLLSGALLTPGRKARADEGAVFTSTNSALANSVVMFHRADNGSLTPISEFFTGGVGTGAAIGNAGAVTLSPNHKWLFVINAGSSEISTFAVRRRDLVLVNRVPSGGKTPFSLTVSGNLLYVVNGGTPANITGFTVDGNGHLTPIPNSTQPLSARTVKPGQIKFSPYGDLLVVTEQTTNSIDVFPVNASGRAGAAITETSLGIQPFGFDFDPIGHLLISEATNSSASSYFVSTYGTLPISGPVVNNQKAACWLISSQGGHYAWTANAAADNLSAYNIAPNGVLSLISPNSGIAVSLPAGSHPTDLARDDEGHVYVVDAFLGAVTALRVESNGTLTLLNTAGSVGTALSGLAAL